MLIILTISLASGLFTACILLYLLRKRLQVQQELNTVLLEQYDETLSHYGNQVTLTISLLDQLRTAEAELDAALRNIELLLDDVQVNPLGT